MQVQHMYKVKISRLFLHFFMVENLGFTVKISLVLSANILFIIKETI